MSDPIASDLFAVDELLTETVDRLFTDHCSHEAVQAAEADGWLGDAWDALTEFGLGSIVEFEPGGRAATGLQDGLEVLRLAGAHSVPLPLAEAVLLGPWLAACAGDDALLGSGFTAIAAQHDVTVGSAAGGGVALTGEAQNVAWAGSCERVLLLAEHDGGAAVAVFNPADAELVERRNMAGEPRPTLKLDDTPATAHPAGLATPEALELWSALSRVALMAGALEQMSRLTVTYTNERVQFGRPVARFQAVQQHLVWAAQDAAMVGVAAAHAGLAAARSAGDVTAAAFEIAAAKLVANQAAARATKACHQAHGAMGMTQEYPLHHLSRRLWSWRKEFGSESRWASLLGTHAAAAGADGLYPLITGGSAALAAG